MPPESFNHPTPNLPRVYEPTLVMDDSKPDEPNTQLPRLARPPRGRP